MTSTTKSEALDLLTTIMVWPSTIVACPTCGQGRGVMCGMNTNGGVKATVHKARHKAAIAHVTASR